MRRLWKFIKSIVSFGASDYRDEHERKIAGDS